jgi:hypothetical protein
MSTSKIFDNSSLVAGIITWGVVAGSYLNQFENMPRPWTSAALLGILSTAIFTGFSVYILKLPVPKSWSTRFLFPIIGATMAVVGRYVGYRFYGW